MVNGNKPISYTKQSISKVRFNQYEICGKYKSTKCIAYPACVLVFLVLETFHLFFKIAS